MNDEEYYYGNEPRFAPAKKKTYEEIEDELDQRRAYGEHAAKEHANEALEELYSSEFPIDDPPDSWERYEAELSIRHLRESVQTLVGTEPFQPLEINAVVVTEDGVGEVSNITEKPSPEAAEVSQAVWDRRVEQSKRIIDVLATYGQVAESDIAALTDGGVHSEVRAYATETLAEIRQEQNESKSLTAAIRDWWRGDG